MNILVISAHPHLQESRGNKALAQELGTYDHIQFHNLYEQYSNWNIDVEKEQQLLLAHDRVVFQFPVFWYSTPPLLKKWFDDVLTFGWAYGPGGNRLQGKEFLAAVTTGGTEKQYRSGGQNAFTISELLRPIQATIAKVGGSYLPAFVLYHVQERTDEYLAGQAKAYAEHIRQDAAALVY
ncbi:flavodoxin family protein [Paenibacillus pinisoli]|uniref:Flavodoxin family protein n=1 Tax=Paenibacillus pinisoli TaxID=1276110 RepID=A0A3A6PGH3_9BACL|nr:NAD(P)H-dependent oxidoreductase [Paenibacillus pinisoli]RJX37189.1 flavodoxin family protein [Paenibacillus pinisoli]